MNKLVEAILFAGCLAAGLTLKAQPNNKAPVTLPVVPATLEAPDLGTWLQSLDWSVTDTAWVLVAEAPVLSACSLPRLQQMLQAARGQPAAALLGGLRPSELAYWAQRQYPGGHQLGTLLADAKAWDSLQVSGQMILRAFPKPVFMPEAALPEHPLPRPLRIRWASTDSVLLDESGGPYSQLTALTSHPTEGVILVDPLYRRLRRIDPQTGTVLLDLDLEIPYEAFYRQFSWPDTNGQSLLSWLDSDAFDARSFLHPEGHRAAWADAVLVLSFTRRYPTLVQDTSGRWQTSLVAQGFLAQVDQQGNLQRLGLCHQQDLPEPLEYSGQSLLPFGPDSGLIALHDFRKGLDRLFNIGVYRYAGDRRVVVERLLPLEIPDFLQGSSYGTRFAEPFLAGHAERYAAGFRLFPKARIYPENLPLQFPDTTSAYHNRLVSTLDRIAERRIAWVIIAEALDSAGRLLLVERRDSLPDRLLVFAADGSCLLAQPLPDVYEGQVLFLQDSVLMGLRRRGDAFWLYRTDFALY